MLLIKEAAAYLDEEGRVESRSLSRAASLTYSTESMQLTMRLMHLASWLLLYQSVCDGDITHEEACAERKNKSLFSTFISQESPAYDELPKTLQDLIERSLNFYARTCLIDNTFCGKSGLEGRRRDAVNPVRSQQDRLYVFFEEKGAVRGIVY